MPKADFRQDSSRRRGSHSGTSLRCSPKGMLLPIALTARPRLLLACAALPVAYVISGGLGLLLAVPPGYATAIFPPAGIAVAAMFMAGAATLPWTFLGSFLLNVWVGYSFTHRLD